MAETVLSVHCNIRTIEDMVDAFRDEEHCWFRFTVTTHTPLHPTKLPLPIWLKAMWLGGWGTRCAS